MMATAHLTRSLGRRLQLARRELTPPKSGGEGFLISSPSAPQGGEGWSQVGLGAAPWSIRP